MAQSNNLTLIPTLSINPDNITFYNQVHWYPFKPSKYSPEKDTINPNIQYDHLLSSNRTPAGHVSKIAKRKMDKSISYLLLLNSKPKTVILPTGRKMQFKLSFVTLTLPSRQIHSDNEIKRVCLNSFLIEIQKYHGVNNFVWRAEKQDNGNLHFHIILDTFIGYNEIRNRWNRIVNKLGYVDRYQEKMKKFYSGGFQVRKDLIKNWNEKAQRKSYYANVKTDFQNPNSTDVHSIRKILNLKAYFSKYMTKNPIKSDEKNKEKETDITRSGENSESTNVQQGRVWGASRKLQNISGTKIEIDNQTSDEFDDILAKVNPTVYSGNYYSVFHISFSQLRNFQNTSIFARFTKYLISEFGFDYQSTLFDGS